MGCGASTQTTADGRGTKADASDSDSEDYYEDSARQIDVAAIEEQSHCKGEQSLLALAMNANPEAKYSPKPSLRPANDADRDRLLRRLDTSSSCQGSEYDLGTSPGAASLATSANNVMSPVKIRVQEMHSSAITTDEHEFSKHLPDIKYSMRSAVENFQQYPDVAAIELNHFGAGSASANVSLQSYNAVRKLQPLVGAPSGALNLHLPQQTAGILQRDFVHPLQQQSQHYFQSPIQGLPLGTPTSTDQLLQQQQQQQQQIAAGRGIGRGPFVGSISPIYRGPVAPLPVAASSPGLPIGVGRGVACPQKIPKHIAMTAGGGSIGGQAGLGLFRSTEIGYAQQAASNLTHALATSAPVTEKIAASKVNKPMRCGSGKQGSSDVDEDDEDDEELVEDDDEVVDWDLGDDVADSANGDETQNARFQQHSYSKEQSHGSVESSPVIKKPPPPKLILTTSAPIATPAQRAAKFRPMFANGDDIGAIIPSASQVESGSESDDDDSNFGGDDNEDVADWFDEKPKAKGTMTASLTSPSSMHSKKQLPSRESVERCGGALVLGSPASSPALSPHRSGAMMTPTHKHTALGGSETLKASPHPPPMQRMQSRQLAVPGGSLSPTKAASGASSPVVGSPTKQISYRSNIVGIGSQVLMPMTMNAATKGVEAMGSAAPIRDTKVVKKKRAELPQRNLPHPTPKFGDWLNSRTMINNYIILESLGSGSYAEVKLCKEKVSGKLFAMKFINRDIMKKDKLGKQSKLDDIKREIAIMKKLNHPNVLRLYEVMDDPSMNKLFLVLEYMKHGDLLSHQKKKHASGGADTESLHDRDLHCVFLQVVLGLAYLHEQKIVHGDIKPQNILVGDKDAVKIADFGISQSLYGSKQKLSDTAGTPAFMSPEMCSGEEYSGQLADIWAVGATIFMLKFGNPPFVAKSALQMFEKIQNDPLVFPFAIDPLLQDLLSGMMVKDPQQRMTLVDVMAHPWITKEETLSSYSSLSRQEVPRITVSNDDIDHAINSKDQFSIIVNIRIQMMKTLQKARQEVLERQRGLLDTRKSVANGKELGSPVTPVIVAADAAAIPALLPPMISDTGTRSIGRTDEQQPRPLAKVKSPKMKLNSFHADHEHHHHHSSSGIATSSRNSSRNHTHDHDMLSVEESNYRSQMFSRKKTGNSASPSSKSRDHETCGFDSDEDSDHSSRSTGDSDDDRDALSGDDDDDDDEAAVAQSPQLLDELLLTTLSLPPLTQSKVVTPEAAPSVASVDAVALADRPHLRSLSLSSRGVDSREGFYGESPALAVRFAVASLQGRRSIQEDRWVVLPQLSGPPQYVGSAFVGLYDGHGGEACASILREQLHAWILRDAHGSAEPLSAPILQTRFEDLDAHVCDYLLQQGDLSGSTATCVVLSPSGDGSGVVRCVAAHVGDCRLVLCRCDGSVREVTQDHRLTLEAERERVLARGGRVVNERVNGVLAISRAFGDLEFKGRLPAHSVSAAALVPRFGADSEDRVPALLSARPDVVCFELEAAGGDDLLLLACDGLWDVMGSAEAAALLRARLALHADLPLAARELAQEAVRRYSNDNITVVVVQLGR